MQFQSIVKAVIIFIWKTHQMAGLIAGIGYLTYQNVPVLSVTGIVAALSAMLVAPAPDVDEPNSVPAQSLFPLAWACEILRIQHRTVTHSFLMMFILYKVASFLPTHGWFGWNWSVIGMAIWWGYISHPLIDLLNPGGVVLLWPFRMRVAVLPHMLAIPVGGRREEIVQMICQGLIYVFFVRWIYVTTPELQGFFKSTFMLVHKIFVG